MKTIGKLTIRKTGMKLLLPILGAGAALLARRILWPPVNLRGKVVLITGGSRGLGFALARAFSRKGCPVVLCARNEEQLTQASRTLEAEGAQVLTIPCDVSDRKQVSGMMQQIMQTMGRVDILVNNAGYHPGRTGPPNASRGFRTSTQCKLLGNTSSDSRTPAPYDGKWRRNYC